MSIAVRYAHTHTHTYTHTHTHTNTHTYTHTHTNTHTHTHTICLFINVQPLSFYSSLFICDFLCALTFYSYLSILFIYVHYQRDLFVSFYNLPRIERIRSMRTDKVGRYGCTNSTVTVYLYLNHRVTNSFSPTVYFLIVFVLKTFPFLFFLNFFLLTSYFAHFILYF